MSKKFDTVNIQSYMYLLTTRIYQQTTSMDAKHEQPPGAQHLQ